MLYVYLVHIYVSYLLSFLGSPAMLRGEERLARVWPWTILLLLCSCRSAVSHWLLVCLFRPRCTYTLDVISLRGSSEPIAELLTIYPHPYSTRCSNATATSCCDHRSRRSRAEK